ncbi:MAG: hypothetical protein M0Z75_05710 [Nitrospiraceae bacterium]|nr:hypothetical protein [Nitrospiraceae bacterium]
MQDSRKSGRVRTLWRLVNSISYKFPGRDDLKFKRQIADIKKVLTPGNQYT